MRIHGTGRADRLIGSPEDDTISGGNGNDWIEGRGGNDELTGGGGLDTFVFRADSGHDVITDFDGDRILLDSQTGVWDGMLGGHLGRFYDGFEIFNSQGTHVATLVAGDFNGDGIGDSRFVMASGATLTLLGVAPDELGSAMLFGG